MSDDLLKKLEALNNRLQLIESHVGIRTRECPKCKTTNLRNEQPKPSGAAVQTWWRCSECGHREMVVAPK